MGAKPLAVKVVALLVCTTVPFPNASPVLYAVPFTGFELRDAESDLTTKYWSAVVAVNEPAMVVVVVAPKVKLVG